MAGGFRVLGFQGVWCICGAFGVVFGAVAACFGCCGLRLPDMEC